jgi:hypothetical protein
LIDADAGRANADKKVSIRTRDIKADKMCFFAVI